MFELFIKFEKFDNLIIFLLLAIVNSLWIYRSLGKKSQVSLVPFILINALLFLIWGRLIGVGHDEAEHLHCAWMVSQGLVPFKDFWQHHSPLIWVVLAPFFKILKPTIYIFEISRVFSFLVSSATFFIGWQIVKQVWREKARLSVYLLVLSSAAITGQFSYLRPDLFMLVFLLAGVYLSLKIPGNKILPSFFAGIMFSLAASFAFKQYLLYLLPLIIIILEKNRFKFIKLLLYGAGLIIGWLPLLFYLVNNNILGEFIYWVFEFNAKRIVVAVAFPIAITCVAVWGSYLLLSRYGEFKDNKSLILFIAFCLGTIGSFTCTTDYPPLYYLAFWFILSAIAGSGCGLNIKELSKKLASPVKSSVAWGLFFSLLIAPNIIEAKTHRKIYLSEDKKAFAKLMDYCRQDTCLLLLALHPVFVHDATRIYTLWQYYFLDEFLEVKEDLKSQDLTGKIIDLRPAVIVYNVSRREIFTDLFIKKVISQEDLKRVRASLDKDYAVRYIGKKLYYIRKDKLALK